MTGSAEQVDAAACAEVPRPRRGSRGRAGGAPAAARRATLTASLAGHLARWNSRNSRGPAGVAADVVDRTATVAPVGAVGSDGSVVGRGRLGDGSAGLRTARRVADGARRPGRRPGLGRRRSGPSPRPAWRRSRRRRRAQPYEPGSLDGHGGRLVSGRGSGLRAGRRARRRRRRRRAAPAGRRGRGRSVAVGRSMGPRSSASERPRRAAAPREAWLFTAPRLMPRRVGDLRLVEVEVVAQRRAPRAAASGSVRSASSSAGRGGHAARLGRAAARRSSGGRVPRRVALARPRGGAAPSATVDDGLPQVGQRRRARAAAPAAVHRDEGVLDDLLGGRLVAHEQHREPDQRTVVRGVQRSTRGVGPGRARGLPPRRARAR